MLPADYTDRVLPPEYLLIFAAQRGAWMRAKGILQQQAVELQVSNEELERFNCATVGGEMRVIELKQQVNELRRQLGRPLHHRLNFVDAPPPMNPRFATTGEPTHE